MTSLLSYFGWSAPIAAAIYFSSKWIGKRLKPEIKAHVADWLEGKSDDTWHENFIRLINHIFGKDHISIRCIFFSSLFSLLSVAALYVLFGQILGVLDADQRIGEDVGLIKILTLGAILNLIPDFISLFETRLLIRFLNFRKSIFFQVLVLIFDLIFSSIVILVAINIYSFLIYGDTVSLVEMMGIYSLYSIFFFSTFTTSLWAWIYCISTWLAKLTSKSSFIKNFFALRDYTADVIAIYAAFITFFLLTSFVLIAKENSLARSFDELMCRNFVSTCEHVARITRDEEEAFNHLERLCELGEIKNCLRLTNSKSIEERFENEEIVSLKETLCSRGDSYSCSSVAINYLYKDGDRLETAYYYFKEACNFDSTNCASAYIMQLTGSGVEQSYIYARDKLKEICHSGLNAVVCNSFANILMTGIENKNVGQKIKSKFLETVPENEIPTLEEVNKLFEIGCNSQPSIGSQNHNIGISCRRLAIHYNYGGNDKSRINQKLSAEYYEKGCEIHGRSGLICLEFALKLRYGEGVSKDEYRAYNLIKKTCIDKYYPSCEYLGEMYYHGIGTDKNVELANEYFNLSCEKVGSCYQVAKNFDYQNAKKRELDVAASYYEKACNVDTYWLRSESCTRLAVFHLKEKHTPSNENDAYPLLKRACTYRDGRACYLIGKLIERDNLLIDKLFDNSSSNDFDIKATINAYKEISCTYGYIVACI